MEAWSLNTLLMCFAGGIVGTALGGLFSFCMVGFIVLLGCAVVLTGGSDFILLQVGLGPIFGPHVGGFSSGVVAATYAAAVKNNHPGGAAKDILSPLMESSWDVLLVGGAAAVVGHALLQAFIAIPVINMADCVALTVVALCMGSRLIFQRKRPGATWNPFGKPVISTPTAATYPGAPGTPPGEADSSGAWRGSVLRRHCHGHQQMLDPMVEKGLVNAGSGFVVPLILGWALAAISLIGLNLGTDSVQNFRSGIARPYWAP